VSSWLVLHLPSWLLLTGLIIVISGAAVLIQLLVRRRFPALRGDEHNDATRFAFGVVSFVYAFFIGFVVSSMWGQISAADERTRAEGAIGVQLVRDSGVFEAADAERVHQALLDYARTAEAEWPQAAMGSADPRADAALHNLTTAYQQVQARTEVQKTYLSNAFTSLGTMSQDRTERILEARNDTGPPGSLMAVVLLTSALVLGCAIIFGVAKPTMHYPMVITVSALVAANLFLVLQLSHPYIGEIATTADPLREMIRVAAG